MPRSLSTKSPSDVRAGYYVVGYTPEECALWAAEVRVAEKKRQAAPKRKKPKRISGLLETKAGADDYAALIRKWGGEVTMIEPTLKG